MVMIRMIAADFRTSRGAEQGHVFFRKFFLKTFHKILIPFYIGIHRRFTVQCGHKLPGFFRFEHLDCIAYFHVT